MNTKETTVPDNVELMSMEDVIAAPDVEFKTIAAWKDRSGKQGYIRIGSLTAGDMIEFVQANNGPAKHTAGLRLIIKSLVDKDGSRIGKQSDLEGLKKKNQKITGHVVDEILKLNGLDKKTQETNAVKNDSSETDTSVSPTDSASTSVN